MTVAITDVVLRDAHQSLFATVCVSTICCPLPLSWTTSATARWSAGAAPPLMPASASRRGPVGPPARAEKGDAEDPLQMLLRGQNLLGYRHYADDVVERFVERAVKNGMDVFRVFDAMNDPRNMQAALQAVRATAPTPGTLSYTTSPAHTLQTGSTSPNSCWRPALTPSPSGHVRHSDAACRL